VWLENGRITCSVIGGGAGKGICGSGLIDAIAVGLKLGLINKRGKLQTQDSTLRLTEGVYLTQEDIRQVQMAKGAIAAGIDLMAQHLGIELTEIHQVLLAGAFGSFIRPESACRIGLLPPVLAHRIQAVGNAAGSGARRLACNTEELNRAQRIVETTEFLELAALPGFQRCFAKNMEFQP
jgi:uncharacterized 2Fe-2S/4Fe-4S cluster protein (DUF4445 family)